MERVATPRLIEAAAALDPASRALLNLWLHRGLPDAALAQMAGIEPGALAARRLDLVERLSIELGLPPYETLAALKAIAPPEEAPAANRPAPAPAANGRSGRARSAPAGPPAAVPSARDPRSEPRTTFQTVPVTKATAELPGRRRGLRFRWAWTIPAAGVALVLVLGLVLVLVLVVGADGANDRRVAAGRSAVVHPSVVADTDPKRRPASPPTGFLRPLPGTRLGARGEVTTAGLDGSRLRVSVTGLPSAAHGRYEVWLYNTIIDSRPLGALPRRTTGLQLRLPPDAARFRWIDVSLQSPGFVENSGESMLRAPNPLWLGRA